MAFNLSSISKAGTRKSPPVRMVIYGTAGVVKTTFATRKAGSIVLQTEDGLAAIRDVDAFPRVAAARSRCSARECGRCGSRRDLPTRRPDRRCGERAHRGLRQG